MNVLIAEDDVNILEGLVKLLEREGYSCQKAPDGEEALNMYQEQKPDFIILDIMMPKVNGYDVCREIRKNDKNIPILFLSAKSEEIDKVVGLELGADDFVSKPFGTRELMARVRAISRRVLHKDTANTVVDNFAMGAIDVYPLELRASRNENSIELGPRDVKILQLLHSKKGKVVTRNELFDVCWGESFFGTTRALDQHISQLRKKIEDNPKEPEIIKTVHGVGYRYE